MLKHLKAYWKSILWLLLIFYLSAFKFLFLKKIPAEFNADKWGHFVMYFIFSLILFYDYTKNATLVAKKTIIIWAIVFPFLFGGLMELIQHLFIPYRTGSFADLFANTLGSFAAFLLAYFIIFRKKYTRSNK